MKEVNFRHVIKTNNSKKHYELNTSIAIPSMSNVFSMSVAYMKNWFFDKIPKEFFKSTNIEEQHTSTAFERANALSNLKKSKPSLQVIPKINYAYNRDGIDLDLGGIKNYITRSSIDGSFFSDNKKNLHLNMQLEEYEISFMFRIRVSTRVQQLNLYKHMMSAFRIGTTQGRDIDMDIHIPTIVMCQIAKDAGFDVNMAKEEIKDIPKFISYMNSYSNIPILYKFRTINQTREFFIRMNNLYAHISCIDDLDLDDGEMEGQLKSNYIVEFNTILHIQGPKMFAYYSKNPHTFEYADPDNSVNLSWYNIQKFQEVPSTNDKGWDRFVDTQVEESNIGKPMEINLVDFLGEESDLGKLILYHKQKFFNPSLFMDFKLLGEDGEYPLVIDWSKGLLGTLITKCNLKDKFTKFVIYVDKEYINSKLIEINELYKSSFK